MTAKKRRTKNRVTDLIRSLDYFSYLRKEKLQILSFIVAVILISLILSVVYYLLPKNVMDAFKLDKSNPSIWWLVTFYTSHFLHGSTDHLLENLRGFWTGSIFLLFFLILSKKLNLFNKLLLIFLTILPYTLSSLWVILCYFLPNLQSCTARYSLGFSGIVGALWGSAFFIGFTQLPEIYGIKMHPYFSYSFLFFTFLSLFALWYRYRLPIFSEVLPVVSFIFFLLVIRYVKLPKKMRKARLFVEYGFVSGHLYFFASQPMLYLVFSQYKLKTKTYLCIT